MPDVGILILLSIIITALISYIVILKRKLYNVSKFYVQASMNVMTLQKEISNLNMAYNNDDFLKFLTTTREQAFQYIEEVQTTIKELHTLMANNADNDEIGKVYQKLISFLPKE